MKLMTKAIEKQIPALNSTEIVPTAEKVAIVKFFNPSGAGTWYAVEGERVGEDFEFFGFVESPLGPDCSEWGYFRLSELESVRGPFGLGIERDIHWTPAPIPANALNG